MADLVKGRVGDPGEDDGQIEIRDHRRPGWYWIENEVLDEHGPELGVYGLAVYNVLSRHANNRSQRCWPGVRRVAAALGTGQHQVMEALRVLEELQLISVERRPGRSSVYTLRAVKASVAGEGPAGKVTAAAEAAPGKATAAGEAAPQGEVLPQRQQLLPEKQRCAAGEAAEQDSVTRLSEQQLTLAVAPARSLADSDETPQQYMARVREGMAEASTWSERSGAAGSRPSMTEADSEGTCADPLRALLDAGVEARTARRLVANFPAVRIVRVITEARRNGEVRDVAGWIVAAVDREFTSSAGQGRGGRLSGGQDRIANCMYHRNPHMGGCLREDPGRDAWPWCKECGRSASAGGR